LGDESLMVSQKADMHRHPGEPRIGSGASVWIQTVLKQLDSGFPRGFCTPEQALAAKALLAKTPI
jgi:hypothetical protein